MISIRMRASKKAKKNKSEADNGDTGLKVREGRNDEVHISGAEGLFREAEKSRVVSEYIKRAMEHPRGKPDKIIVTIEELGRRTVTARTLPVTTLMSASGREASKAVRAMLSSSGVSERAIEKALAIVYGERTMRGAAIIAAGTGRRREPDRRRGVRATRFGIGAAAERSLGSALAVGGLNTTTVKEALLLASKVASCNAVVAELCVSDDPDYTTGYVSSKSYGYVRIPRIKKKGERKGGRVFFVEDDADIGSLMEFIERTPVMMKGTSRYRGTRRIDEIVGSHNL